MFSIFSKKRKLHRERDIDFYLERDYIIRPSKEALIVVGIYGVFGFLWIILSDKLLDIIVQDMKIYRDFQTYKGWIYVLLTMILIYYLVHNRSSLFQKSVIKMRDAYEKLQSTNKELVATKEELIYQKSFTEDIIDNVPAIISTWDEKGRIKSLNSFGEELLGYSEDEVINKEWIDVLIPSENKSLMTKIIGLIKRDKKLKNYESSYVTRDNKNIDILWNSSIINSSNRVNEYISVGTDITSQKNLEEKLKNIAYYDSVTNLPNRRFLEDEVELLIKQSIPFSLIFMNIDNFKYVNNILGHSIGDEFLNYIASKLQQVVKPPNSVVRLSGDEYAILLNKATQEKEIEDELKIIINYIGRTWKVNHYEFFISFSLGISIYPKHGMDKTTLFRNADVAMYKAKKTSKGRHLFYTEEFLHDNTENMQIANELQYAIDNEELTLYYQPMFSLNTGEIIGLEALLRWNHKEKGFISPAEFIPLAEKTGQIYDIEKWVFKTSLLQKKKFEEEGKANIFISINLSSKTLMSNTSFYELQQILGSFKVDYSHITIEITETAIIENVEFAIDRLERLKQLGIRIALDDFGTGYSSLTYLGKLPIDIVKLDRSFVNKIEENSKEALIIKSLLNLVHDLNYEVVAEGIETKEQLIYLKKYNCESGQGYLMSRPLCIEDIEAKLKTKFQYKNDSK